MRTDISHKRSGVRAISGFDEASKVSAQKVSVQLRRLHSPID